MDMPHTDNFCGGNFQDWLEVMLIKECNGKCSWCIEKGAWHPEEVKDWKVIADAAIATGKTNIILLGGEPTLYKDINKIIFYLISRGRKVWITTNGSKLTKEYVSSNLRGVSGINISIHDYFLVGNGWPDSGNDTITGIALNEKVLEEAIKEMHKHDIKVRFNCNCIKNYIHSRAECLQYVIFAKNMGADSVRFAELKKDEDGFVDLAKIFNYAHGLNDDPFHLGCHSIATILGMPVSFRQMCGLQTSLRIRPVNPCQHPKQVLYYDGKIYDGWQTKEGRKNKGDNNVNEDELVKILEAVENGSMTVAVAAVKIDRGFKAGQKKKVTFDPHDPDGGCQY